MKLVVCVLGFMLACVGHGLADDQVQSKLDSKTEINFNRDIRPILSAKCFACHGPDASNQESGFRVDSKEAAFADLGGYAGVVPGKPEESELFTRISSDDEDLLMPPPDHKNPLSPQQIETLKVWIQQGAPFATHWAFEKLQPVEIPTNHQQLTKPIDQFVAAKLDQQGLTFSKPASPETLFRRIHLDLTGLPPSLEDLDLFLAEPSEEAYQNAIQRLMSSPAFAERMAMEWLDVARYADTNGYSIDDHRDMWAWRDWVIRAFQLNQPYDQFIRHQIAGDLIQDASEQSRVATGFLRNSMNTHEGGTIPEEYRVAAIADKIDVVATAFLGLTMKCAQCHDHKYDAISQRDYYRFFAFFNTSAEPGNGAVNGNTKPFLKVDPILQSKEAFRKSVEARIAALNDLKFHPESLLGDARSVWEQETLAKAKPAQSVESGPNPTPKFRVPKSGEAGGLSWIWSNPAGRGEFAWFRKKFELNEIPESAHLYVSCDNEAEVWINGKKLGRNPDWRTPTVFDLKTYLVKGENLVAIAAKDWEQGRAKAALVALVALPGSHYLVTNDSWQVANQEIANWNQLNDVDGFVAASVVAPHGNAPWGDTFSRLKTQSNADQRALLAALREPESKRTAEQQALVATAFAKSNSDMNKLVNSIDGEIKILQQSLKEGKTTVMVMDESKADRKTPILIRGQYDQHGEFVSAGIPSLFESQSLPNERRQNRLDLANWLIDPDNPLTARVTVNRYWQMLFGTGLVKTAEDFGSQGDWPSHPELLDYLAKRFIDSGWDVRALLTEMLLSKTYRQSSNVSKELLSTDPYNRLLARAPRFRLSAEAIRDGAFAAGGLLDRALGGPSVYPPQPSGLWKEVSHFGHPTFFSAQHFYADKDNNEIFRRSMYTFWKRTSPPPVMSAFDAPNRETSAVRRSRTNTPLQALVLMNEPQFVEASYGLAQRMISKPTLDGQLRYGFRLATSRYPSNGELEVFRNAYTRQLAYFESSTTRAQQYVNGRGDPRTAAMMSIASLILNLDETITRE